ncbi:hypothetical protein [Methylocystis echinoides]|uniref:hypothetical protein n=1 Tax=Methylocystis echinoides TaxID=29468 RepID=UPI00249204CD|nr:hypothetical protein [Methylocystis echinoides]
MTRSSFKAGWGKSPSPQPTPIGRTLTKDEFLSAVSALFKDADQDNEVRLDEKEFAFKQGKALLRVTR